MGSASYIVLYSIQPYGFNWKYPTSEIYTNRLTVSTTPS
jgi:hypothetical protein